MDGPVPVFPEGREPLPDLSDSSLAMRILTATQLCVAQARTTSGKLTSVELPSYVTAAGFGWPPRGYDALVFWSAVENRIRWADAHGGQDHFMVLLDATKQNVRIVSSGEDSWAVQWHPSELATVEAAPPYDGARSDERTAASVLLDEDGLIVWANDGFAKILELDADAVGLQLREVLPADMRAPIDDLIRAALDTGVADQLLPTLQPVPRWLRIRGNPVTQVASGESLLRLRIEEVALPHDEPAGLADEIVRDSLTGLYNRRAFIDIAALDDPLDSPFTAVVLADIRRFRRINDVWGQTIADQALAEVAGWLRAATASSDVLIRLTGDQFIVLCTSGSQLVAELEASPEIPVPNAASQLMVTVRAGWTARRPGQALLAAADRAERALEAAKVNPLRRVVKWNAEISRAARTRVAEEEQVRQAIGAGDVAVYFQPLVDTSRHQVEGLEALVRLPGPGARVGAERIITASQDLGLTPSLAQLVCDRAFSDGVLLHEHYPSATVGVNVSREFMASGRAIDIVIASATTAGLAPSEVVVELTEEVAAGVSPSVLVAELRRAVDWGLAVLIDDFGRGETALSTLRGLPLTGIKLDRSLVPTEDDADGWRFIEAIVVLLRTLARTVVVEGVETVTQSRRLREAGVSIQQGYLFGEPQPATFWMSHADLPLHGLATSDQRAL